MTHVLENSSTQNEQWVGHGCNWSYSLIHLATPSKVASCDSDYKSEKNFEIGLFFSSNAHFFDPKSKISAENG